MSKLFRTTMPTALAAAALLYSTASLAQAEPQVENLNTYKCKDVMRLSGQERDVALALLHGYALGKKGSVTFVPEQLTKVSNDFVEYCLDHPADNLLEAFAKIAKY